MLSITRHGPLIEAGSNRWLMSRAPPLPPGATLSLELSAAGPGDQSARLLAIRSGIGAERVLEPAITVRLQPAATGRSAAENAPRPAVGVQVEARLLGPTGRPVGAAALVWLSAVGVAATRQTIFEVELSRLGRCQLGVLSRPVRFDMVVRTEAPLAAALQDDIRILVQAASEVPD